LCKIAAGVGALLDPEGGKKKKKGDGGGPGGGGRAISLFWGEVGGEVDHFTRAVVHSCAQSCWIIHGRGRAREKKKKLATKRMGEPTVGFGGANYIDLGEGTAIGNYF